MNAPSRFLVVAATAFLALGPLQQAGLTVRSPLGDASLAVIDALLPASLACPGGNGRGNAGGKGKGKGR